MTQEDKKLLVRDLGARMSYGVIVSTPKGNGHLCGINQTIFGNEYGVNIDATKRDYFNDNECDIKPYLRSMSSMTEKERIEFERLSFVYDTSDGSMLFSKKGFDWLNTHHFDYRGLIEKGLAIAITKENNPYEKQYS